MDRHNNCELRGTPHCPNSTHEYMLKFLAGRNQDPIKMITDKDMKNAEALCADCDKFEKIG